MQTYSTSRPSFNVVYFTNLPNFISEGSKALSIATTVEFLLRSYFVFSPPSLIAIIAVIVTFSAVTYLTRVNVNLTIMKNTSIITVCRRVSLICVINDQTYPKLFVTTQAFFPRGSFHKKKPFKAPTRNRDA